MRRYLISLGVLLAAVGGPATAEQLSRLLRSQSSLSPEYRDLIRPPVPGALAGQPRRPSRLETDDWSGIPIYSGASGVYQEMARAAARKHSIPEDLFLRLVRTESGFRPTAKSSKGAIGLAQLMPYTARNLGVNPHNPEGKPRGRRPLPAPAVPALRQLAPGAGRVQRRTRGGAALQRRPALQRDPAVRPRHPRPLRLALCHNPFHNPPPLCFRLVRPGTDGLPSPFASFRVVTFILIAHLSCSNAKGHGDRVRSRQAPGHPHRARSGHGGRCSSATPLRSTMRASPTPSTGRSPSASLRGGSWCSPGPSAARRGGS